MHVHRDGLTPVECSCVASRGGEGVRLGEEGFADLEVVEPYSFHVGHEILELAPAVVRMPVEGAHKQPESVVAGKGPRIGWS
jgi:hypothetical protein